MQVLITYKAHETGAHLFDLHCGKQSAQIRKSANGPIWVCCQNASHRVWKGLGKSFATFDQALQAYKSPAMQAMIRAAADHLAAQ